MGRPPRAGNWKTRATTARAALRKSKHGGRTTVLRDADPRTDANTLRREIFALNFLDALRASDPGLRKRADGLPFSIVELLARWAAFDETGAIEATLRAIDGAFTVASLTSAMAEARKDSKKGQTTQSYRSAALASVLKSIRDLLGGHVWEAIANPSGGSPDRLVDFSFDWSEAPRDMPKPRAVAAVIVGPYADKSLYAKRMRDWLLRTIGLASFYDHLFLFVEQAETYRSSLAELLKHASRGRDLASRIHIRRLEDPPSLRDLSAEDDEAIAEVARISSGAKTS